MHDSQTAALHQASLLTALEEEDSMASLAAFVDADSRGSEREPGIWKKETSWSASKASGLCEEASMSSASDALMSDSASSMTRSASPSSKAGR